MFRLQVLSFFGQQFQGHFSDKAFAMQFWVCLHMHSPGVPQTCASSYPELGISFLCRKQSPSPSDFQESLFLALAEAKWQKERTIKNKGDCPNTLQTTGDSFSSYCLKNDVFLRILAAWELPQCCCAIGLPSEHSWGRGEKENAELFGNP